MSFNFVRLKIYRDFCVQGVIQHHSMSFLCLKRAGISWHVGFRSCREVWGFSIATGIERPILVVPIDEVS